MNNCIKVIKQILDIYKIDYTLGYLKDVALSNPNYPSLQCIADTFDIYNIENIAIKTDSDKLNEIPLPCVVQIVEDDSTIFCVLKEIRKNSVVYINEFGKSVRKPIAYFLSSWSGIALLLERREDSKEPEIGNKYKKGYSNIVLGFGLLGLFCIWVWNSSATRMPLSYLELIYLGLKVLGLLVSLKLILHENKIVPDVFCKRTNKIDCNAILQSKYSKIVGGAINLSSVAFAYFFSSSICFLVDRTSMPLISILSFASIPVILYSLYIQGLVVMKWCKLCLIIIGVLLFENMIIGVGGYYRNAVDPQSIITFLTFFTGAIVVSNLITVFINQEKDKNVYKRGLLKFKTNKNVFKAFLLDSGKISTVEENLGLNLSNHDSKYKLLLVINPYCEFCSRVYYEVEQLFYNRKIDLQIIFSVTESSESKNFQVVSHFLAFGAINKSSEVLRLINLWYKNSKNNYKWLSSKYPINEDLNKYENEIIRMNNWCDNQNIERAPAVFINEIELPKEYNVKDLKWVLTV